MSDPIYLVTGAAGFVGSEIVRQLTAAGVRVRAMVRPGSTPTAIAGTNAEIVEADLTDAASLEKAAEGVSGVYHIAALFRQAGLPEAEFFRVNETGTKLLLDACIDAGVKRFVHCSTVGVHGHVENPPGVETTAYSPGDMYQRSKVAGEKVVFDYFSKDKIRGVMIRPAMIWGPNDTRTAKLFKMIGKKRFFYVGRGEASVHFIDVRDLARAFILAMNKELLHNEVYIIAGETAVPLKVMADKIAGQLGVSKPWLHLPVKPMQWLGSLCEAICTPLKINPPIYRRRVDFYTKSRHFDGSKAARDLGFKAAQDVDGEIRDIIASYRTKG